MPLQEGEISWQMLRRIVQDWAGTAAELTEVKTLAGGSVNTTLALTTSTGDQAVLKVSPHRVNRRFLTEAYQLNILRTIGLPAPQVYVSSVGDLDNPVSYLLMEFLDGVDLAQARRDRCTDEQFDRCQMHLAELMLALHQNTNPTYTRLTESDRREFDDWPAFYRHVYDGHWAQCEKTANLPVKTRKTINKVHERLDRLIAHDDAPRLVHWDVWSTNVLVNADDHGKWWVCGILDPNCKYAHAEAEIAYMDLFKTTTPAFLRAYQQTRRLPPDYHRLRKHVYQLYELINHVNTFGNQYLTPLLACVERLAAVV